MATKKSTKKKTAAKGAKKKSAPKSAAKKTTSKSAAKKTTKKIVKKALTTAKKSGKSVKSQSPKGILTQVKEAVDRLLGTAAGAAEGAVEGVVEASDATGAESSGGRAKAAKSNQVS